MTCSCVLNPSVSCVPFHVSSKSVYAVYKASAEAATILNHTLWSRTAERGQPCRGEGSTLIGGMQGGRSEPPNQSTLGGVAHLHVNTSHPPDAHHPSIGSSYLHFLLYCSLQFCSVFSCTELVCISCIELHMMIQGSWLVGWLRRVACARRWQGWSMTMHVPTQPWSPVVCTNC